MIGSLALALLALAVLLLVAALIPTLWELRRTARSTTETFEAIRREIHPLSIQLQGALEDHRDLTRRANKEMARVEELTERLKELAEGWGRVVGFAASLTRVGRIAGTVHGVKKGLDVFLTRLSKGR
jgi:uncharacterized protein YoxC